MHSNGDPLVSAPEKEEKKTKWGKSTAKAFSASSGCKWIKSFYEMELDTCQATCLARGGNAINYRGSGSRACVVWLCKGTPPTPSYSTPPSGMVAYYKLE